MRQAQVTAWSLEREELQGKEESREVRKQRLSKSELGGRGHCPNLSCVCGEMVFAPQVALFSLDKDSQGMS